MRQFSRPQTIRPIGEFPAFDSYGTWHDQDGNGNAIDLVSPIAERARNDATWVEGRTVDLGAENDFEWVTGAGSSRYSARLILDATPFDNPWYSQGVARPTAPTGEVPILRAVLGKPPGTGSVAAQVFTPGLQQSSLPETWSVVGNGASEGDTYRLTIDGAQWTDPIAWAATAGAVRSALASLDAITSLGAVATDLSVFRVRNGLGPGTLTIAVSFSAAEPADDYYTEQPFGDGTYNGGSSSYPPILTGPSFPNFEVDSDDFAIGAMRTQEALIASDGVLLDVPEGFSLLEIPLRLPPTTIDLSYNSGTDVDASVYLLAQSDVEDVPVRCAWLELEVPFPTIHHAAHSRIDNSFTNGVPTIRAFQFTQRRHRISITNRGDDPSAGFTGDAPLYAEFDVGEGAFTPGADDQYVVLPGKPREFAFNGRGVRSVRIACATNADFSVDSV